MLGARIAALRIQAGMSQAELGKRLSVSPSAVGMYEQGRREPSMDRIVALSKIFGVTTDYLLTGQLLTPGTGEQWSASSRPSGTRRIGRSPFAAPTAP